MRIAAGLMAATLALAACGGGDGAATTTVAAETSTTVVVETTTTTSAPSTTAPSTTVPATTTTTTTEPAETTTTAELVHAYICELATDAEIEAASGLTLNRESSGDSTSCVWPLETAAILVQDVSGVINTTPTGEGLVGDVRALLESLGDFEEYDIADQAFLAADGLFIVASPKIFLINGSNETDVLIGIGELLGPRL